MRHRQFSIVKTKTTRALSQGGSVGDQLDPALACLNKICLLRNVTAQFAREEYTLAALRGSHEEGSSIALPQLSGGCCLEGVRTLGSKAAPWHVGDRFVTLFSTAGRRVTDCLSLTNLN